MEDKPNEVSYGLRGRKDVPSLVKLPIRPNEKILNLAKIVRPYHNFEVRVRARVNNKNIEKIFEDVFGSRVTLVRKSVKSNFSKTINIFLKTFFIYDKNWKALSAEDIRELSLVLDSVWH